MAAHRSIALLALLGVPAVLGLAGCKGGDDTSGKETGPVTDTQTDPEPALDGDGDGITVADGDCDDSNPNVYPGRLELCNGVDDNCNDVLDEGTADADGDGTCDALDVEECDGADNDGDGRVDEDFTDADRDGIADCVDVEECDGVDNNGDGVIDEDFDADGDGYGLCGDASLRDCDDGDAQVNPGRPEQAADLVDNDCDGAIDEGDWSAGDLVITEIMRNPASISDPAGEWVEVLNASGRTVALNGITLSDDTVDWHVVSWGAPLLVEPGEYAVLGSNGDYATNGGVVVDYAYADMSLGNERDSLTLSVDDDGAITVLDAVAWDDAFPAPSGASMVLDPDYEDGVANDDAGSWCAASAAWGTLTELGSPGAVNPPCSTIDHDGDGVTLDGGDCDDEDGARYPGAAESDPALDQDCDGVAEWGAVAVPVVGAGSSTEECGEVQLNGSASYDPDGIGPFSYQWELVSAPAGSSFTQDDIEDADRSVAWIEPDLAGDYVFWLWVWDAGFATSGPVELVVTIDDRVGNNAPTADAGGSRIETGTIACNGATLGLPFACKPCADRLVSLSGMDSVDPDGDSIVYAWEVLAGNASLSTTTGSAPQLTVSGTAPDDIGDVATEVVYVGLTVTDCMGTVSTQDIITVSYECTGVAP